MAFLAFILAFIKLLLYLAAQCAFLNEFTWIYPSFPLTVCCFRGFVCLLILQSISCKSLKFMESNAVSYTYGYTWVFWKQNFEHPLNTQNSQSHVQINGVWKGQFLILQKISISYLAVSVSVCFINKLFWGSMSMKSAALFLITWLTRFWKCVGTS